MKYYTTMGHIKYSKYKGEISPVHDVKAYWGSRGTSPGITY